MKTNIQPAIASRALGDLDDDAQRKALIDFCIKKFPGKYFSFMRDQFAPRFNTIEEAERFVVSLEEGRPDWSIPVLQFETVDRVSRLREEWKNAQFELIPFGVSDKPFGPPYSEGA